MIKIKERKLKTSELLKLCKDKFPVYSYLNDKQLDEQFPIPETLTEREFQDNIEPDPETLGKSVNQADPDKNGVTLRERIIAELEYFEKTGNHLDIKGATLCSGSRYSDGYVPYTFWVVSKFKVDWLNLDDCNSDYGIRLAVALKPQSLNPSETSGIYGLNERVQKLEEQVEKLLDLYKQTIT